MTIACVLVPASEHDFSEHPESPARFRRLGRIRKSALDHHIHWLEAEPAQMADVARVHDPALLKSLKEASAQGPMVIEDAPTYVTPASWPAALLAAGGTLACALAVVEGTADSAFALVRPPGHHAEPGRAMGFCLLNNLAIAVGAALERGINRVLIVDYDAHHGNGTQEAFLHDERVAFLSTHEQGIYPGSGRLEDAPTARGRIVNLPLPAYAGDGCFERIFHEVLQPLAERAQPEMIFVSAGFDAHWGDPLTTLGLSTGGFFRLNQGLIALARQYCGGRIAFVLEGGYDAGVLAENALGVLAALAGEAAPPDRNGPSLFPEPDITLLLSYVRELHRF